MQVISDTFYLLCEFVLCDIDCLQLLNHSCRPRCPLNHDHAAVSKVQTGAGDTFYGTIILCDILILLRVPFRSYLTYLPWLLSV